MMQMIRLWTVALIMLPFMAQAAIPDTINYQGYITDSAGTPLNGTFDMSFYLYDVEVGGSILWTSDHVVTVNNGKFNAALGENDAFPVGLFDNALYLGVEFEADGEMIPRKPLLTAPYAFKSGDADTLGGMSASAFIGTSGAQTISGSLIVGDTITTDTITIDTIIAEELIFPVGTGGIIFEDGSSQETNAVNSILAADGTGSTLDADLVDGMQASEIIDAASDEVRTPISQTDIDTPSFTISTSGSYYFTENLTHASTTTSAIQVNADHVTIDMMGFTLSGPGSGSGDGIRISGQNNVTILNGTVREFGDDGIAEPSGVLARAHRVIDVRVVNNGRYGIFLLGANHQVRGCTAQGNGSTISDFGIRADTGSLLINNTAADNAGTGILGGSGSTLTNNTAYNNAGFYGIYGGQGATVTNNTAHNNSGAYGIYGGFNASLRKNTAYSNAQWGIYGDGSNLIEGNMVNSNNTSDTANAGGIRVGFDSRVAGNTLDSNDQYNIFVFSNDNILERNHVTDATDGAATGNRYGIYFANSGNAFRDNTASGNATNFGGNVPTGAADGGGNIEF